MTQVSDNFDRLIGEMEQAISRSFEGRTADDRLFALRDLLLAQLKVCVLHYKLMSIEREQRLLFSETSFTNLVAKHLEISKCFREAQRSRDKSTYEMKSIISLYNFISHHFVDERYDARSAFLRRAPHPRRCRWRW